VKTLKVARMAGGFIAALTISAPLAAQEPALWGSGPDIDFHTFSIVAVDPRTGETGVIVTTRGACVGNAVPWVRAGVGAVATQGGTRLEYGNDLLDLLEKGMSPQAAMDQVVKLDEGRENRQAGVIDIKGNSAQWTGKMQYGARGDYVQMRKGATFAVQGNSLVSTDVVDAIADTFQKSEGSSRTLADRMIEAEWAGQILGGDMRHGNRQSAALLIADPRPGMARRPDKVSVNINVCEHPEPVGELRRIYDTTTEKLGFRKLEQLRGRDVLQLQFMLHALGFYRPAEKELSATDPNYCLYSEETVKALDAFRVKEEWGTTVPGWVDQRVIDQLWLRLEEKGLADAIRKLPLTLPRRG
jgi:uncharacterized Ntn-hydrolase superfamily protein